MASSLALLGSAASLALETSSLGLVVGLEDLRGVGRGGGQPDVHSDDDDEGERCPRKPPRHRVHAVIPG
jgi:hypothetical protein